MYFDRKYVVIKSQVGASGSKALKRMEKRGSKMKLRMIKRVISHPFLANFNVLKSLCIYSQPARAKTVSAEAFNLPISSRLMASSLNFPQDFKSAQASMLSTIGYS